MRLALIPEHAGASLHDLVDRDDPLLIEMLRRHVLRGRGITAKPEEILITLGSQHGLGLIATALLSAGSTVAIEEPGYPDARHMVRSRGADIKALPVDDQGAVIPPDLSDVDMVFVTPSHQYPTNTTLSIGRRQALLSQASRDDFVIIEDDYDSEFRYLGQSTPAMKSIENSGRVIYLGSFSKFLAPGLRLGFVVAEPRLIEHLRDLRRYQLRHPPGLLQRALALFIESGDYNRSVRRVRKIYKEKWAAMSAAVDTHIPWPVPIPTGGLSIWVTGPPDFDATTMAELAMDEGVVVEAGEPCFVTQPIPRNHFKLGYASTPLPAIEPGLAVLARVIARLN
jgi:GntR family transcriptional regulator/MocR family aminotransferase